MTPSLNFPGGLATSLETWVSSEISLNCSFMQQPANAVKLVAHLRIDRLAVARRRAALEFDEDCRLERYRRKPPWIGSDNTSSLPWRPFTSRWPFRRVLIGDLEGLEHVRYRICVYPLKEPQFAGLCDVLTVTSTLSHYANWKLLPASSY
jgi:hypothetical protein